MRIERRGIRGRADVNRGSGTSSLREMKPDPLFRPRTSGDANATAPIIVESRGAEENRRTLHALGEIKTCMAQMVRFTEKAANVPGLQLADLCARPIGIKVLRPDAKNRAFDESVSLLMQARDSAMPASGAIITL